MNSVSGRGMEIVGPFARAERQLYVCSVRSLSLEVQITASEWRDFEDLVSRHLHRTCKKVRTQPTRKGSRPDFTTRHFLLFRQAVDAKHKNRMNAYDVHKLKRDMRRHGAIRGVVYVSKATHVPDSVIQKAHRNGIRFRRLGWNGHLLEEF